MDSGSAWIAGSGHSSCRRSVSQKLRSLFSLHRPKKDLQFLKELVEAGKVTPSSTGPIGRTGPHDDDARPSLAKLPRRSTRAAKHRS